MATIPQSPKHVRFVWLAESYATPARAWLVAQTRRRIVRLALVQADRPGLRSIRTPCLV